MTNTRNYKSSDIKRLFTLASNECAWPGCCNKLIAEDNLTVIGKICHISGASEKGPRWHETMTDDERRSFDNLILLCDEHHQIIDNPLNVKLYPIEVLKKWKSEHEAKHLRGDINFNESHFIQLSRQLDETNHSFKKLFENGQIRLETVEGIKNKLDHLLERLDEKNDQQAIDSFVAYSLGEKNYWVDSERLKAFEKVLSEHNATIIDRGKKFDFSQRIIESMFNVSELKEITREWRQYRSSPQNLNHLTFIRGGLLAFSCLDQIPIEILNDLQRLPLNPIHSGYYDGHLASFINEIKIHMSLESDLIETFKNDRYLFENLKRIIESLLGYLRFDVKDLYVEKEQAFIISKLPGQFLILGTSKALLLCDVTDLNKILASLPLNKNFPILNTHVHHFQGRVILVSCTSQECFFWNPETDITTTIFYKANGRERIKDVFSELAFDGKFNCQVQLEKEIVSFTDFEEVGRYELFRHLNLSKLAHGFIGYSMSYLNSQGPVILYIDDQFKVRATLTIEEIRDIVRNSEPIKNWLRTDDSNLDDFSLGLNDIQHIRILPLNCSDRKTFLIRGVIKRSGILLIARIHASTVEVVNILLLEDSSTITVDSREVDGLLELCCGYLDLQGKDSFCELMRFRKLDKLESSITIKGPRRDTNNTRDILNISFGPMDRIFLNEEGKKIWSFSRTTKVFSEYPCLDNERFNEIKFVDLI